MSNVSRFAAFATAVALLSPLTAFAQPTAAGAPPAGSTVIDFNGLANTALTTQFAGLGVTISGGACSQSDMTGSGTSFSSAYVANYLNQFTGDQCPGSATANFRYPALTFTFVTPIQYFGVSALVNYNRFNDLSDLLNFTTATGSIGLSVAAGNAVPARYVAIQDAAGFTSVTLSTGGNGVFLFDNLTFSPAAISTVPEPSTWALMGMGLLVTGAMAARRKRNTV